MGNKELFNEICQTAYNSVFWSRHKFYVDTIRHRYGPMISSRLFYRFFDEADVVGAIDIEKKLGRRIKVKELIPCPLSCDYFLFCSPIVLEDLGTRNILLEFKDIIEKSIKRCEKNAVRWERGREKPYSVSLYVTIFEDGVMREEVINL